MQSKWSYNKYSLKYAQLRFFSSIYVSLLLFCIERICLRQWCGKDKWSTLFSNNEAQFLGHFRLLFCFNSILFVFLPFVPNEFIAFPPKKNMWYCTSKHFIRNFYENEKKLWKTSISYWKTVLSHKVNSRICSECE